MASKTTSSTAWAEAKDLCIYCGVNDYSPDFGPRTLLICCSCQAKGGHVECEQKARGAVLTEQDVQQEPWFCSEVSCFTSDLDGCESAETVVLCPIWCRSAER